MQIGKIQCDECKFVGELVEDGAYKNRLTTPAGWALITSMVRIAGERELTRENRATLKKHINGMFPRMHICPRCVFKDAINISRMLDYKKA